MRPSLSDTITEIKAGSDDVAGTGDDFTNLINHFLGAYAYSYTFDGQAGYLAHALANTSLLAQVTGAADWHINSDEPDVLDYDTSFKPAAQDALYESAQGNLRATDRLARKSVYQMLIEEEFNQHGTIVEYVLGQYDDSDEGRLQKQIRASIAEYEKAKILERSKRGKRGKANSGFVVVGARPPYG